MSVLHSAGYGSYAEFLDEYEPSMAVTYRAAGGKTLLFASVANRDVEARVAITTRLLDDGADPSVVSGGMNVLHILFDQRNRDARLEAPMLRRLIDGGADINQVSKRWGPPLIALIENCPHPESAAEPFYDVIFDQPNLDLSAKYGQSELWAYIFGDLWNLPILRERTRAYQEVHRG